MEKEHSDEEYLSPYELITDAMHPEKFTVSHLESLRSFFIDDEDNPVRFRGFSREKLIKNASTFPAEQNRIRQAIKHAVKNNLMKEQGNPGNGTYEVHLTEPAAKGILAYLKAEAKR